MILTAFGESTRPSRRMRPAKKIPENFSTRARAPRRQFQITTMNFRDSTTSAVGPALKLRQLSPSVDWSHMCRLLECRIGTNLRVSLNSIIGLRNRVGLSSAVGVGPRVGVGFRRGGDISPLRGHSPPAPWWDCVGGETQVYRIPQTDRITKKRYCIDNSQQFEEWDCRVGSSCSYALRCIGGVVPGVSVEDGTKIRTFSFLQRLHSGGDTGDIDCAAY